MHSKYCIVILICAIFSAGSNAFLRMAFHGKLNWNGSFLLFARDMGGLVCQPVFIVGLFAFAIANLLWFLILASQKLSIAFPVQIGLVVVFNSIITVALFDEKITTSGYLGMIFIVTGVIMLVK